MTRIRPDILTNWEASSRLEWLVTNGIGGYGSGSLAGANTRRYHGLLVAACRPPLGRTVILSKLEEEIRIEEQVYFLSANKYPSIIYPQGYRHMVDFTDEPVPTFTFSIHEDTVQIGKRIWMAHGSNTIFVQYTILKAPVPFQISLAPFMAYKDYHTEQRRWGGFTAATNPTTDGFSFLAFEGAKPVYLSILPGSAKLEYKPEPNWFYNYEHEREEERGLDAFEDLYCPGKFSGILNAGDVVTFAATLDGPSTLSATPFEDEKARKDDLLRLAKLPKSGDPAVRALVLAADQFIIPDSDKVDRATIIAGYPWFADWGRDTMISLRGLCLSTGRSDVARSILSAFAKSMDGGLIPNRFTDDGKGAEFNTVDATLWLFEAAYRYALETGDWKLLTAELLNALTASIDSHLKGTHYSIHVDGTDGLLYAGEPGVQLTWMDAKVGDHVITPRIGKPVEIQALWYNALRVMADIAQRAGVDGAIYTQAADKARESFSRRFINSAAGCLFDVIDGPGGDDGSIRPNQLFALSLSFPILDARSKAAAAVVDMAAKRLLTPMGLRTLSPTSPGYLGTYGPGDQGRRDAAYHMGTVWPWLFGAFVDASRAVRSDGLASMIAEQVPALLARYGIGSIAEIFDGDEPFVPNGCIAQAWSVAEILRVLRENAK